MKKLAVLVAVGSLAAAASAQETIGTLQGVTGAVSISGKNFVSKAKDGAGLTDGASVLVSSTGKATIALKNGCTVSLGANQHLTVNSKLPCEQISASVKHLFPAYQVAQAPIGAGLPSSSPKVPSGSIPGPIGLPQGPTAGGVAATGAVPGTAGWGPLVAFGTLTALAANSFNNNTNKSVSGL